MSVSIIPQELSNGVGIEFNDDVWTVVEFQHVKPGKGGSFVRTKLKSLTSGRVVDHTFKGTEKIFQAEIERKKMQYLYMDAGDYVFMDLESYEQFSFTPEIVGRTASFIKEGSEVAVIWWRGKPINLDIGSKVDLRIVETMPGERGNTVTNATKPAKLETGLEIQVPMFINPGDTVRVDTRDGKYEVRV